jgi:hypothetical protein
VTDPPVTDPPVTDPPVTDPPVTDPPVTDPPVTDPPVTDPPVTDPPVTDPPVTDPPRIIFFGARPNPDQVCEQPNESGWVLAWLGLRADSAQLTVGGVSDVVNPIGGRLVCALPGTTAVLTLEGEGGTDSATIVLG